MDIQPLDILKWVGIALAAGFIGYFGRYLAMLIIDRVHKKKARTTSAEPTGETVEDQSGNLEKSRIKLEKKKAKQAAKQAKKENKN